MKKSLCGRKREAVVFAIGLLFLSASSLIACSPVRTASLVKIENKEEQFQKIEKELEDLKEIKVKCLAPERFKEMKDIIYENYFCNKEDTEHLLEKESDGYHSLTYEGEDMYQLMT